MGWCCVLYVCTSFCKGESLWGSCEYVTTSGLVLLTQRDTLLAFNMLFPCWWGRVLVAPKEKKFSITNCTAVLFFFYLQTWRRGPVSPSTPLPLVYHAPRNLGYFWSNTSLSLSFATRSQNVTPGNSSPIIMRQLFEGLWWFGAPSYSERRTFSSPVKWAFMCLSIFFRWNTKGSLFTSFTAPESYQGLDPQLFQ